MRDPREAPEFLAILQLHCHERFGGENRDAALTADVDWHGRRITGGIRSTGPNNLTRLLS